ncbi:MAG TPA: hypothetical protein VKD90_28630 [Gemmataceae bacterium]|nr:hypothetical protein [Gemmataceae bacterium]
MPATAQTSATTALFMLAALSSAADPAPKTGPARLSPAAETALREAVAALDEAGGDTLTRTRLWCEIATFRRIRGDRDGAVAALAKARDVAESGRRPPIDEWRDIGPQYARLGDAKAVLDLAERVPTQRDDYRGNPRELVLQEAARAAADAGHIKPAEQIAEALPDTPTRKFLRDAIGRQALIHRAANGDAAGAIRDATRLPNAADTVLALVGQVFLNLAYDDVGSTDGIAHAQLAAGDREGAAKTAGSALALLAEVDAARRAVAALAVVRMLARLDDLPAARKALAQMPPADPKADPRAAGLRRTAELIAKGFLAAAEVRAGRDDAAVALAGDFTRPGEQAYVLHFVALAQARAGRKEASAANFAKSIDLVTRAPASDRTGTSLHNIASAQAAAGDFAGAAKTAALNPSGALAWANLASYQASAGDFAGALKAAEDHLADNSFWSSQVMRAVAEAQARAGREAAAREGIGKLTDPLVRAHALFGLARGLAPDPGKGPVKR